MPTIQGTDIFAHNDFTVPGGAFYSAVTGTPEADFVTVWRDEPASLKLATAAASEVVKHSITGGQTIGWQAFAWRLNAADEPGADQIAANLTPAAGADLRFTFAPLDNCVILTLAGVGDSARLPYTFDTWLWVEMILDVSSGTRAGYARVIDESAVSTDLSTPTSAIAASTVTGSQLGRDSAAATYTYRYGRNMWGFAANSTDWFGLPTKEAEYFLPVMRRG